MKERSKYTGFNRTKVLFAFNLVFVAVIAGNVVRGAEADTSDSENVRTVLFFGDSLTSGYNIDLGDAYPAIIGDKLRENGLSCRVVNAGLSGETTAGGLRRVDWILRREIDVFVLALGGNDALRGFDPKTTRENLKTILERVRERYPDALLVLAGMRAPPNMGNDYTNAFAAIYPDLAEELDLPLIPFLLEGMAVDPEYNLDDLIHPNERGHRVIAETVWETLEPLLRKEEQGDRNESGASP